VKIPVLISLYSYNLFSSLLVSIWSPKTSLTIRSVPIGKHPSPLFTSITPTPSTHCGVCHNVGIPTVFYKVVFLKTEVMHRLRPLKYWDRQLKSHLRHGCLCAFIPWLCCPVCVQRPCDGLNPPSKESYRLCKRSGNWKAAEVQQNGCRAIDR
jgi:hypothetical protein